jgi:toxin ParE1/3/4
MQIKWLAKALRNLDDEAEYIARDDPAAARLVVQKIYAAVALLIANPELGRIGRLPDTRELIIPNTRYIIPYRIKQNLNRIEILRVFHASRRLSQSW